ncbi:unnamed protein product, partial [Closterium sp. NIES-64]
CYSGGPSLATNQDSRQQPGARQLIGARQHQDLLGTPPSAMLPCNALPSPSHPPCCCASRPSKEPLPQVEARFRLSALSILQSKYLASASAAGRRSKGQEKGAAARVQGAVAKGSSKGQQGTLNAAHKDKPTPLALCSKPALQLGAEATRNGQQKGATGSRKVQRAAERCNGQQSLGIERRLLRVGALEQGRGESTVSLTSSSSFFPSLPAAPCLDHGGILPSVNPPIPRSPHFPAASGIISLCSVVVGRGKEAWGEGRGGGRHGASGQFHFLRAAPPGLWLVGRGVVGGICAARHSVLNLSGARGKWITMEGKDDSVGGKRRKGGGGVEEWGM